LPEGSSLLTKPFSPDELTRRVRESLGRSGVRAPERGAHVRREADEGAPAGS